MNSLFLPATVWRFECEGGVSWWAQKAPMLRAAKLYDASHYIEKDTVWIPQGSVVLSLSGLPHRSRFSLMKVKRVPVDSRW